MSTALALVEERHDLPAIQDVQARVLALVDAGAVEELGEARRRAEALQLYEQRAGHEERKLHYFKLQVLTEAALGSLSFDDPDVIERKGKRNEWRALAAALERGKLLEVLDSWDYTHLGTPTSPKLSYVLRGLGYLHAPGEAVGAEARVSVPWSEARVMARTRAIDPAEIPPDPEMIRRRERELRQRSRRMRSSNEAYRRLQRMKRRKEMVEAAALYGPRVEEMASLLRKTLQAAHAMQEDLPPRKEMHSEEREALDELFEYLHYAEDSVSVLIGIKYGRDL